MIIKVLPNKQEPKTNKGARNKNAGKKLEFIRIKLISIRLSFFMFYLHNYDPLLGIAQQRDAA